MPKKSESIYIDVGFENLMSTLYGKSGHPCAAGQTSVGNWKKQLNQLFRTLRTAIEKNVNGDDPYKAHLLERCDVALMAIKAAGSKDEIACDTVQFCFELLFSLLGNLPDNWQSRRAHHSHVTDLSKYRTLSYVGTARQKAKRVTDAAYHDRLGKSAPKFEVLVDKLRIEFGDNPIKFLTWLKREHREIHDRFI